MSKVFLMSGIFSSNDCRRWVRFASMYRYLLRFRQPDRYIFHVE